MLASNPKVLLTVPHAGCFYVPIGQRMCDTAALRAARHLSDAFARLGARCTMTANTETPRWQYDMNRSTARQTPWRTEVDSRLIPDSDVVMDIHSFPASYQNFGRSEVTVMAIVPVENLPIEIYTALVSAGVVSTLVSGTEENDICVLARRAGKRTVLLEFNESLDDATMFRAAKVISEAVCR